jgi:hypothetical protein
MHTVITDNVHRHLEQQPQAVAAALRRLQPLQPLRDSLLALGMGHLAVACRTDLPAETAARTTSFSLTWQLAGGRRAHVSWALSVSALGTGDSLLSARIRAGTDCEGDGEALLAAWPVLGQIVESHTKRLLGAVTELGPASVWPPRPKSRGGLVRRAERARLQQMARELDARGHPKLHEHLA